MGRRRSAAFRCRSRSSRSGWRDARAIAKAFAEAAFPGKWRSATGKDGHVFVTDGGHWIVDAHLGRIADPPRLAGLNAIPGVVEHGLFIGLASRPFWRAAREFA